MKYASLQIHEWKSVQDEISENCMFLKKPVGLLKMILLDPDLFLK